MTPVPNPTVGRPAGGDGGRRRHRWRLRWVTAVVAVVVTMFAVVVALVVWPDPPERSGTVAGLELEPGGPPAGPVRIDAGEAPLVWVSSEPVEVQIEVVNDASDPVFIQVWWLLGERDDPSPWLDPVVQPEAVPMLLEGDATETVSVPADLGLVDPGIYRLSLWVHTLDPDDEQWHHADGRTLASTVLVTAPTSGLSHVGGTSAQLWIQQVSGPRSWHAGEPATVTVQVANAAPTLASVQVWWFLSPTASAVPWEVPGSVQSETVAGTADPGGVTELAVPVARLPDAGTYRLTVWLHQQEPAGRVPRDGVLVDVPVPVVD